MEHSNREELTPDSRGAIFFAALVPHRDAAAALEKKRRDLFTAGFSGAFAFPAVIPLAILENPLADAELKTFAAELRRLQGGAKFTPEHWRTSGPFSFGTENAAPFRLWGPEYQLPDFGLPRAFPALFAASVLDTAEETPSIQTNIETDGEAARGLAFRAAALANLRVIPAALGESGCSFAWEMGKRFWLPRPAVRRKTT